jgi:citrate synthase
MSLPLKQRNDTSFWDRRRGSIVTKKGGIVFGKGVYCHGHDMMEELTGRASYFQVMMLNATGRLPEKRVADWVEAMLLGTSYPDARIWCNQIGSLAGTMGASPVAAVSAGILASDSDMYGPGTLKKSAEFIRQALGKRRLGASVEEIIRAHQRHSASKPVIVGYARPVANGDERVGAMQRVSRELGFAEGEHVKLALTIDAHLRERFGETINLAGYLTAFLCDQGYTPEEIYRFCSIAVSSGVLACYAEAADQPPESFFPLQCEDIDYQGKPPREVPEQEKKQ